MRNRRSIRIRSLLLLVCGCFLGAPVAEANPLLIGRMAGAGRALRAARVAKPVRAMKIAKPSGKLAPRPKGASAAAPNRGLMDGQRGGALGSPGRSSGTAGHKASIRERLGKMQHSSRRSTSSPPRPATEKLQGRQSWRASEKHAETAYSHNRRATVEPQKAFFKGNSSSSNFQRKGSSKPDGYVRYANRKGESKALAFEVKNYRVSSAAGRQRLVHNVSTQINRRQSHLPAGTRQQVVIDVRGQRLSQAHMREIQNGITAKTGIKRTQISFMRRFSPKNTP